MICPLCTYSPGPERTTVCPRDGRRLVELIEYKKSPKDRYLGTCLAGKYPLLGILGIGGMSTVYRGLQEPVGREVAVKVVPPDADNLNAARARFQREAQVVARLHHPNIVTMYDFGVEPDGTLFMVQEKVDGPDLSQVIRSEGALGLERTARIILQVLAALAEAHGKNLVHRDMKPDNIMLAPTTWGGEQAKVLDFGIARMLERSSTAVERLTKAGIIFGTPDYMSPEQVAGNEEIGFPADVYSLGVVIFEMLSGKVPFFAPSFIEILLAHRERPLPHLPTELGIPREVEEVIRRAAAKEPGQRYANAGEMLLGWEEALAAAGVVAPTLHGSSGQAVHKPPGAARVGDDQPQPPPAGPSASSAVRPAREEEPSPKPAARARAPGADALPTPGRAKGRGTKVLEGEQPATTSERARGGADWVRDASPAPAEQPVAAVHFRPTLVVAAEEETAAHPVRKRKQAEHDSTVELRGARKGRARRPADRPPAPAPATELPATEPIPRSAPPPEEPAPGQQTEVRPLEHFTSRHRSRKPASREAKAAHAPPPTVITPTYLHSPSPTPAPATPGAAGTSGLLAWLLMSLGLLVLALALVLLFFALR